MHRQRGIDHRRGLERLLVVNRRRGVRAIERFAPDRAELPARPALALVEPVKRRFGGRDPLCAFEELPGAKLRFAQSRIVIGKHRLVPVPALARMACVMHLERRPDPLEHRA